MFKNVSYKKLTRFSWAGGILLFFLSWQFVFKKTIQLKSEVNSLLLESGKGAINETELKELELELITTENLLGAGSHSNTRQVLLNFVSGYCSSNNLLLRQIPGVSTQIENGFIIETNSFIVDGGFLGLLKLHYEIETKLKTGHLSSVEYRLNQNKEGGKKVLSGIFMLQNVKKKEI
jgi:hypothetical protein